MKKVINVVMLPTEKADDAALLYNKETNHYVLGPKLVINGDVRKGYQPQHLYFLSDDKAIDGDWAIRLFDNAIFKVNSQSDYTPYGWKKIIATTDDSLIIESWYTSIDLGEQPTYRLLPRPSNEFLKKYCKLGGISKVLVEYECDPFQMPNKVIDRLKVAPDNTITIYPYEHREQIVED